MAEEVNNQNEADNLIEAPEESSQQAEERVLPAWMLKAANIDQPEEQEDAGKVQDTAVSSEMTNDEPDTSSQRKRVPCKYGEGCYRRNPVHKEEYSHPGDEDYIPYDQSGGDDGGASDQRPECQYGTACYRQNPQHRRDFKHTLPPQTEDEPAPKKTRRQAAGKRKRAGKESDYESEGENKYDFDDPFIDDTEEDEDDEEVGEEEEDEDYQPEEDPELLKEDQWKETPEDTPEVLELLKEARDYLRNKKLHK